MFIDLNCFLRWAMWPMGLLLTFHQSVRQSWTICQHNSSEISWNFVVMKDILCRCTYLQGILIQILSSGNHAPFEHRNLSKIKYTTETVCQCNSSENPLQNFMKLCRTLWKTCRCAYLQEILIQFGGGGWNYDPFELGN